MSYKALVYHCRLSHQDRVVKVVFKKRDEITPVIFLGCLMIKARDVLPEGYLEVHTEEGAVFEFDDEDDDNLLEFLDPEQLIHFKEGVKEEQRRKTAKKKLHPEIEKRLVDHRFQSILRVKDQLKRESRRSARNVFQKNEKKK